MGLVRLTCRFTGDTYVGVTCGITCNKLFIDNRNGGEGGIRTLGKVTPTHAFQACSFNHSDTSPYTAGC